MSVRAARLDDVPALVALHLASFGPAENAPVIFGPRYLAAFHRTLLAGPTSFTVVADGEEGRLAGALVASRGPYGRRLLGATWGALAAAVGRRPALVFDRHLWRRALRRSPPLAPAAAAVLERAAEVVVVMVAPAARGRGLFAELLGAAARRLAERGCESFGAWVYQGNAASRRAFEKAGWSLVPGAATGDTIFYCGRVDSTSLPP